MHYVNFERTVNALRKFQCIQCFNNDNKSLYACILINRCQMAEDANYPFAYSKYHGQGVERKVRVVIIYGIE